MPSLCGAWVLSGASAEKKIKPGLRAAMLRACGPGVQEIWDGPLWLCAAATALARRGRTALGVAGFLVEGDGGLDGILARWNAQSASCGALDTAGHLALACADLDRLLLTLYRDPFGAERLFHIEEDGVLFFASRAKVILAGGKSSGLDVEAAREAVLSGDMDILFGSRTLYAGVSELRPGETMSVRNGRRTFRRRVNPFLEPEAESEPVSPVRLRKFLLDATRRAIGSTPQVAVSLSGGMDSPTFAALAVEVLGAKNVEAFTYDFDDPSHVSEAPPAALVCRRLGIRQHVVMVRYQDYLERLPELLWRLEGPRLRPGAWLALSRAAGGRGFSRILTGHGLEYVLGTLCHDFAPFESLTRMLESIPLPNLTLRHWKLRRFDKWPLRRLALRVHPGLELPAPDRYHLILCVLRHNGIINAVSSFYPGSLGDIVRDATESKRVKEALAELDGLRPLDQLKRLRCDSHHLVRMMRGKQAGFREAGAVPISPALFLPRLYDGREGRAPHREALIDDLPAEILTRPKLAEQAIIPMGWRRKLAAELSPLALETSELLAPDAGAAKTLLRHYESDLALLGLWRRIFDAGPVPEQAPTFESLGLGALSPR